MNEFMVILAVFAILFLVIGVIYESRPNVTVDISALCLKSGNTAILRGGKEAAYTNRALAAAVAEACEKSGAPRGAIQLIQSPDRALVKDMLTAGQYIDMIIPRGGAGLHQFALENATIPVITGGIGICHIYVDESADPEKVVPIVHNAKVQRPTVCNALDTLLIHHNVAQALLPKIADDLARAGVELRCEPLALSILMGHPAVRSAGPADFDTEFLSLVLAVKVVSSLDEALDHIYQHSTRHSDAIITESYGRAMRFVNEVDSAAVYVNASTRFTDGGQFGREKYMLPEETLFYPYSDCEDRAILFAYLVRKLTNLDVIALHYPNHIATAVNFSDKIKGDAIKYRGKRYVICDPTYIGADIGRAMPKFRGVRPKVIRF